MSTLFSGFVFSGYSPSNWKSGGILEDVWEGREGERDGGVGGRERERWRGGREREREGREGGREKERERGRWEIGEREGENERLARMN